MSSSECDIPSDSSEKEKNEDTTYTKSKKIFRTVQKMILVPTEDELNFRRQETMMMDVLKDCPSRLLCTRCDADYISIVKEGRMVYQHPLLKVLFCESCCGFYGNGDFSLDEDEEDKYCRWCGEGGTLFLCSRCICGFCPSCIEKHFGPEKKQEVEDDDDWICFICQPRPLWDLRNLSSQALSKAHKQKRKIMAKSYIKIHKSLQHRGLRASSVESVKSSDSGKTVIYDPASDKQDSKDQEEPVAIAEEEEKDEETIPYIKQNDSNDNPNVKVSDSDTSTVERRKKRKRKRTISSASEVSGSLRDPVFNEIKDGFVQNLSGIFHVVRLTSTLCEKVCKKRMLKLKDPNHLKSVSVLLREFSKIEDLVECLSVNLSSISDAVDLLRSQMNDKYINSQLK